MKHPDGVVPTRVVGPPRVIPVHALNTQILDSTVYDIVPAQDLPQFDPSITLKKRIFPRTWLVRLNHLLHQYAFAIRLAYVIGLVFRAVSAAAPMYIAQWTAPMTIPLQLPALFNVIIQFRIAFLKLLIRTYDFWYYIALSSVWAISMSWYFRDGRAAIIPIMWMDVQNATLLDAFLQDFQAIVTATWISCLSLVGVMMAVSLDTMTNDNVFVKTKHRTITVKEELLNTTATIIILIMRVLYRKRASMRTQDNTQTTRSVESITLTWPLRLRERVNSRGSLPSATERRPERHHFQPTQLQLHLTLQCKHLKASDVLIPGALKYVERVASMRWVVRLLGAIGMIMMPIVFCVDAADTVRIALAICSIVCTCIYSSIILVYYHRRLFTQLVTSFDFAFVSLQLTAVHLCVADTYRWQTAQTLCVVSSWLWLHIVMTVDALTPVMRRVLGFRSWAPILVLLLHQVAAVFLWLEVSIWDSQHLYNRRFFDIKLGGHQLVLHVVPCLLNRLFTVCLWAMRMLYRIATPMSDHDLLFLRSHVQFDALFHRRIRRRHSPCPRVAPSPNAEKNTDMEPSGPSQEDTSAMTLQHH